MNKCIILGGGTFNQVACHLALAAPAFGATARKLYQYFNTVNRVEVILKLTKMADYESDLITSLDLENYIDNIILDKNVKAIILTAAICDFKMENPSKDLRLQSGKNYTTTLEGVSDKLLSKIRLLRKDIFLVGFKTTAGDNDHSQIQKANNILEFNCLDMVLANDISTRKNILLSGKDVIHGERDTLLRTIMIETLKRITPRDPLGRFEVFKCYQ